MSPMGSSLILRLPGINITPAKHIAIRDPGAQILMMKFREARRNGTLTRILAKR